MIGWMSADHPLLELAREAPERPGVYCFKDRRGKVIYVGKARVLRRRVLSYFARADLPERTLCMLEHARALEFTVTVSEVEAFILENTLIKRHRPRFNVLLRDDKTYPYIKVTTGESWPRALLTRRVRNDGHAYFGPFMGQYMARRLMELVRTRFAVRTCHLDIDGQLERPCLYYHMQACLGPCVDGLTTHQAYQEAVTDLQLFLAGRHRELLPRLEKSMWTASECHEFERAAKLRDLIAVVTRLSEQQNVDQPGRGDADVCAAHSDGEHASVCLLVYREGKLVDKREFHFEGIGDVGVAELTKTFLAQYYELNPAVPARLDTFDPLEEEDRVMLEAFLSDRRGKAVHVASPKRGPRRRRVELAARNARTGFELRFRAPRSQAHHLERRLGEALGLDGPVHRLECFDISHAAGKHTTASCVVWVGGRMDKRSYRSFNITATEHGDDYSAIAEAVGRRYKRLVAEDRELPDLVLIDGGVGQLNAARAALASLELELSLAALAKREEQVWLPEAAEPVDIDRSDPAHLVLRQVRDEAHRFAVHRQRRRRKRQTLSSSLLNVPGIGPGRTRTLLKRFGSVAGVQRACRDELQQALGQRLGAHLWNHLHAAEEAAKGG